MFCVEMCEDNGLQWFCDVGVVFKHTHLKYGVFLRNIVFFHKKTHLIKKVLFSNPSILILTRPKNRYFFLGTCP